MVRRQRTEEQIATPDDLCTPETTFFDEGENYGVARLKPASSYSLSLPNVHLSLFLLMKYIRKEGRKGRRKEVYKTKDDKILINDAKVTLLELL